MAATQQSIDEENQFKREKYNLIAASDDHLLHLEIERLVCQRLSVSLEHVHGLARGAKRVVFARHLVLYLLWTIGRLSLRRTGAMLGRDRRMVAYAIGRIESEREDNPALDRTIDLMAAEVTCVFAARRGVEPRQAIAPTVLQ